MAGNSVNIEYTGGLKIIVSIDRPHCKTHTKLANHERGYASLRTDLGYHLSDLATLIIEEPRKGGGALTRNNLGSAVYKNKLKQRQ